MGLDNGDGMESPKNITLTDARTKTAEGGIRNKIHQQMGATGMKYEATGEISPRDYNTGTKLNMENDESEDASEEAVEDPYKGMDNNFM